MRCMVKNCTNESHQGSVKFFTTSDGVSKCICSPCWNAAVDGKNSGHSQVERNLGFDKTSKINWFDAVIMLLRRILINQSILIDYIDHSPGTPFIQNVINVNDETLDRTENI